MWEEWDCPHSKRPGWERKKVETIEKTDEVLQLKKENMQLKAENERLKKALTAAPSERREDPYLVVQQVQGLLNQYISLREEKGKLQNEISTKNEDIRRYQKMLSNKENGK